MESPDRVGYATPKDFDRALTDRIALAATTAPYRVPQLRRQFAYGRLLARVFLHGPERWVLKGATGLLARIPGRARHSMDVDLYFSGTPEEAIGDLQDAVDADLGDFFSFDIAPGVALSGVTTGRVLRVTAYLGDKIFETFPVDVVVTHTMTTQPDVTPPIELFEVPGLQSTSYRTYPISDQIADKYSAIVSTYSGRPSTRYRDLVDLVVIARTQPVEARLLSKALSSEHRRRGIASDEPLKLPSAAWREGYAKIASTAPNFPPLDADGAIELVRRLVEPIAAGRVNGEWNPMTLTWDA
ncbi:MAG: nucleotidyl transferase AbiEii/AbiGii toxin family protein [Actinomycetota bacterium]|nr:nucleotidyl transferase AbiEii/AbiGii toxin family protein [Actinomycetota bacterium]